MRAARAQLVNRAILAMSKVIRLGRKFQLARSVSMVLRLEKQLQHFRVRACYYVKSLVLKSGGRVGNGGNATQALRVWNGAGSISVNESLSKIGRDLPAGQKVNGHRAAKAATLTLGTA